MFYTNFVSLQPSKSESVPMSKAHEAHESVRSTAKVKRSWTRPSCTCFSLRYICTASYSSETVDVKMMVRDASKSVVSAFIFEVREEDELLRENE